MLLTCWWELSPRQTAGVSLSPPSLAPEESQRDDSQNKAALPLPWLESGTQRPIRVPRPSVCPPGAGAAGVRAALWLQQRSPPASAREGASECVGIGAGDDDRRSAEQSFVVIRWDFCIDRLPEHLVSESLLLRDSAERVILAGYRWWKNVLPALECIFER